MSQKIKEELVKIKCFDYFAKFEENCANQRCRHWINYLTYNNCSLIAANNGPLTEEEVCKAMSCTRQSIIAIMKKAYKKLRRTIRNKKCL